MIIISSTFCFFFQQMTFTIKIWQITFSNVLLLSLWFNTIYEWYPNRHFIFCESENSDSRTNITKNRLLQAFLLLHLINIWRLWHLLNEGKTVWECVFIVTVFIKEIRSFHTHTRYKDYFIFFRRPLNGYLTFNHKMTQYMSSFPFETLNLRRNDIKLQVDKF